MAKQYDAIVIGTGFGGTITALTIAREFYLEWLKDKSKPKRTVLMLERGTWWTTPVGTVQDKEVGAYTLLKKYNNQPVQFWSSNNSFRGAIDLITRCLHREGNVDGLYELTRFGSTGILGLFRRHNDGLTVLRACGVGGGSLVYSNITVQPPDLIFNDDRWDALETWNASRNEHYDAARTAIGEGILKALKDWDLKHNPMNYTQAELDQIKNDPIYGPVNTGLSQIVTRNAGINPHWKLAKGTDGKWDVIKNSEGKPIFQPDWDRDSTPPPAKSDNGEVIEDGRDFKNDLWIDRTRIFQAAMKNLNDNDPSLKIEYTANTLSINDYNTLPLQLHLKDAHENPINAGDNQFQNGAAKNYCERQGRCNVGCLPGARHTLNKQLVNATYGKFILKRDGKKQLIKNADGQFELEITPGALKDHLEIKALCEVKHIEKKGDFDYVIHYRQHHERSKKSWRTHHEESVAGKRVIVSAGCIGTNELMLRSVANGGLNGISETLGEGFSTNGDMIYILPKTKERVRSIRGPIQTSHAQFNLSDPGTKFEDKKEQDANLFHMIEDLGIPPAFATTIGFGTGLFKILANGRHQSIATIFAVIAYFLKKSWSFISGIWKNRTARQEMFENEDEISSNFLVVTTTGRERAKGKITLGGFMETPLRITRKDDKYPTFADDPVYTNIDQTLKKIAGVLADKNADAKEQDFINPSPKTIGLSHPLGGCKIGIDATKGVVDEFGHVYDATKKEDPKAYHAGLYIADASVIPTALGVNPSLTISAVCWQIANNIRKEL